MDRRTYCTVGSVSQEEQSELPINLQSNESQSDSSIPDLSDKSNFKRFCEMAASLWPKGEHHKKDGLRAFLKYLKRFVEGNDPISKRNALIAGILFITEDRIAYWTQVLKTRLIVASRA
jgi:hypothetical protein